MSADDRDDGWAAGWDETRERQVLAWASATPDQRVAWLEDAIRLAWATGALPRRRSADESWGDPPKSAL
jgi:hypothetical protein